MKIDVELYGDEIGTDGNLKNLIEHKECTILLTVSDDEGKAQNKFVLNKDEAMSLVENIQKCVDNVPEGFKLKLV